MNLPLSYNRLLSIILNHLYPDGNVRHMIPRTTLVRKSRDDHYALNVDLPNDHWSFTQTNEPKQFEAQGQLVMDLETKKPVAFFATEVDARDYARHQNELLSS